MAEYLAAPAGQRLRSNPDLAFGDLVDVDVASQGSSSSSSSRPVYNNCTITFTGCTVGDFAQALATRQGTPVTDSVDVDADDADIVD